MNLPQIHGVKVLLDLLYLGKSGAKAQIQEMGVHCLAMVLTKRYEIAKHK